MIVLILVLMLSVINLGAMQDNSHLFIGVPANHFPADNPEYPTSTLIPMHRIPYFLYRVIPLRLWERSAKTRISYYSYDSREYKCELYDGRTLLMMKAGGVFEPEIVIFRVANQFINYFYLAFQRQGVFHYNNEILVKDCTPVYISPEGTICEIQIVHD